MASKPKATCVRTGPDETSAPERPWLKAYPQGVAWDAAFKPSLMGDLLDQAVKAYGARP